MVKAQVSPPLKNIKGCVTLCYAKVVRPIKKGKHSLYWSADLQFQRVYQNMYNLIMLGRPAIYKDMYNLVMLSQPAIYENMYNLVMLGRPAVYENMHNLVMLS